MKQKTALFIGRFQPVHLGHLSVLQDIDQESDIGRILIGIGSSQEALTAENPFTFRQREKMVENAVAGILSKPYKIFGIQDMFHNELWYQMVRLTSRENFDVVYSGNDWVREIFKERNVVIRKTKTKLPIHGSQIRELIKSNRPFKHLVPMAVFKFIKSNPLIIN